MMSGIPAAPKQLMWTIFHPASSAVALNGIEGPTVSANLSAKLGGGGGKGIFRRLWRRSHFFKNPKGSGEASSLPHVRM